MIKLQRRKKLCNVPSVRRRCKQVHYSFSFLQQQVHEVVCDPTCTTGHCHDCIKNVETVSKNFNLYKELLICIKNIVVGVKLGERKKIPRMQIVIEGSRLQILKEEDAKYSCLDHPEIG